MVSPYGFKHCGEDMSVVLAVKVVVNRAEEGGCTKCGESRADRTGGRGVDECVYGGDRDVVDIFAAGDYGFATCSWGHLYPGGVAVSQSRHHRHQRYHRQKCGVLVRR